MNLTYKEIINAGIGIILSIEEELKKGLSEIEELKKKGEKEKPAGIQQFERLLVKIIKDTSKFYSVEETNKARNHVSQMFNIQNLKSNPIKNRHKGKKNRAA